MSLGFIRGLGSGSVIVVMFLATGARADALADADKTVIEASVPPLAFDDTSVTVVWNRPARLEGVVDYLVSINGVPAGRATENARAHSPARPHIEAFDASDTEGFHVRVIPHSFVATGLRPATEYRFQVRAALADGRLSPPSAELVASTAPAPVICRPSGAVGDGRSLDTRAIQKAIDACPPGGQVVLTDGVFRSGALFLKSDLTLKIGEGATLLGSDRAEDYAFPGAVRGPVPTSPPSLLNAIDPNNGRAGAFKNIRIVGTGTIDGDGFNAADPPFTLDELGEPLPERAASNAADVGRDGVLAKSQVEAAVARGLSPQAAYGRGRSSLMTLRGVEGLFVGGVTLTDPAFHGAVIEESRDVTIQGLIVKTHDTNNGDGVDLGHDRHTLVFDSYFDSGDDCLNLAAGVGADAERRSSQSDTWIFGNYFRRGHGAVVLGSHTGAWIENVLAEDNVIFLTDVALRAKSAAINGGGARNALFRNTAVRDPNKQAFIFTLAHSDPNAVIDVKPAATPALFHDIRIENVSVEYTDRGIEAGALEPAIAVVSDPWANTPARNLVFDRVRFKGAPRPRIDGLRDSVFRDVTFASPPDPDQRWSLTNTDDIRFEGATVPPKP